MDRLSGSQYQCRFHAVLSGRVVVMDDPGNRIPSLLEAQASKRRGCLQADSAVLGSVHDVAEVIRTLGGYVGQEADCFDRDIHRLGAVAFQVGEEIVTVRWGSGRRQHDGQRRCENRVAIAEHVTGVDVGR